MSYGEISQRVARRILSESAPIPSGEESFYHGENHMMDVRDDLFVHFTYDYRAIQILKSGYLLTDPPHEGFGMEGVQAVSAVWGKWVPKVQTTHLKDPQVVVAIVFKTDTEPEIGYREEVIWKKDVRLIQPKIVSKQKGAGMLRNTPQALEEGDIVFYV